MLDKCSERLILMMILLLASSAMTYQTDSVYTDISPGKCKTIKVDRESGGSVQRCPGIAGYYLLVEDDDARQSVTVVTPGGKRHPLDYWEVITPSFSTLGAKAEWRVERRGGKVAPVALIVRVNSNPDSNSSEKKASYLAVAKITSEKVCVTDKIEPSATANEEARRAADAAASKACLSGSAR